MKHLQSTSRSLVIDEAVTIGWSRQADRKWIGLPVVDDDDALRRQTLKQVPG
jgi:hypothetical protein